MSVLVIDVGTTGLRAAIVRRDGTVANLRYEKCPPTSPFPGLVEFDAAAIAQATLRVANEVLSTSGPIDAVGITTQRASTVMWDARTLEPLAPGLGWQDLRTVGDCISARAEHGLILAPNQTATKAKWLLANTPITDRSVVRIGTIDSYVAAVLSNGTLHVTDHSNAAVTGLFSLDDMSWSSRICDLMGVDVEMLPTIVPSSGVVGHASALAGSPPIACLVGDQQSSLVGQGCITPGQTKITFGTGGMLDVATGHHAPTSAQRSSGGTFPIIAHSDAEAIEFGAEAIMLSAGSNVEWLCEDLGLIESPADSDAIAASVDSSDGVVYVPALLGLGTPNWDYGARGTLLGITRGTTRAHIVRAVLEGIAQRGADLVDAARLDTGCTISALRIDGGMSRNATFVHALANASMLPVEVSPVTEATTLGAGFLAGVAVGTWQTLADAATTWAPTTIVEPTSPLDRDRWRDAVGRAAGWIPELSGLDF